MALKISPNTIGLMAATMMPMIERGDIENILFREHMQAYGKGISLKEESLRKIATIACDLAHAIEDEMDLREKLYPKDMPIDNGNKHN